MKSIFIKINFLLSLITFLQYCANKETKIMEIEKKINSIELKIQKIESKIDSLTENLEEFKKNIEIRLTILKSLKKENPKEFKHPWDKSCNKCH